jgi:MFS family permease
MFFTLINFLTSWRYLFFCIATPLLGSLPFMYKCFLESPRFLVSKGCFKQAREIFWEISITNRRPPYEFRLIEEMDF